MEREETKSMRSPSHANLNIDKLSPGVRITAYLSMESPDGLIHLLSSRSIILPSSSPTKKTTLPKGVGR